MEKNWEQLIDRYLMDELSADGKRAFEEELKSNPVLNQALTDQLFVMETFERKAQRSEIQQLAKHYHFKSKWKYWSFGLSSIVGIGLMVVYFSGVKSDHLDQQIDEQKKLHEANWNAEPTESSSTNDLELPAPTPITDSTIIAGTTFPILSSEKNTTCGDTAVSNGDQVQDIQLEPQLEISTINETKRNVYVFRYSDGNLLSMPQATNGATKQVVMDLVVADYQAMIESTKGQQETNIALCFDQGQYYYLIGYEEQEDDFDDFLKTNDIRKELKKKLKWSKSGEQQLDAILLQLENESKEGN